MGVAALNIVVGNRETDDRRQMREDYRSDLCATDLRARGDVCA